MLGKTKGGTRSELDAAAFRSRRGFHLLHEKFVDKEVVVTLPEQWEDSETACKIDERLGAGMFEEHAQFDPNNDSRIELAWQTKEVQGVFQQATKEYQAMIDLYMMGTGGGVAMMPISLIGGSVMTLALQHIFTDRTAICTCLSCTCGTNCTILCLLQRRIHFQAIWLLGTSTMMMRKNYVLMKEEKMQQAALVNTQA